jgi:hypothetical protein
MEYLDKVVSGNTHSFNYTYKFWKQNICPL